jgi:hypothetical protein
VNRYSIALVLVLAGCDSRAKTGGEARADALSKEYESCASSADCEDKLRCFDRTCRRTSRNTVGDYYAALGAAALAKNDAHAAIAAYEQAMGHYEQSAPPDVDCAYGTALAAGRARKEDAELGAKVLHRCIMALPAGSSLRDKALADLATLADSGLDPLLLGANKLADVYLKLAPAAPPPPTDHAVTATANPAVSATGFQQYLDKAMSPDLHAAMLACWEAYTTATKKDTMVVSLAMRNVYIQSQYDDEPGGFTFRVDPATGLAGAEAAADACVRGLVEPAIKDIHIGAQFSTKLVVTVK